MATITPYLNFNGNCEEAFKFYKSVFGGEFTTLMRFNEVPPGTPKPEGPSEEGNWLMHVSLPLSEGSILMGSDRPSSMGKSTFGDNFSISVNAASKDEADKLFKGLSTGGNTIMPLADTFWGSYFGMASDKFGVQWMVSYDAPKQ